MTYHSTGLPLFKYARDTPFLIFGTTNVKSAVFFFLIIVISGDELRTSNKKKNNQWKLQMKGAHSVLKKNAV